MLEMRATAVDLILEIKLFFNWQNYNQFIRWKKSFMKGIFENVVADSNGKGRDPSRSARGMDSTRPDRPVISERVDGATTRGGKVY